MIHQEAKEGDILVFLTGKILFC